VIEDEMWKQKIRALQTEGDKQNAFEVLLDRMQTEEFGDRHQKGESLWREYP